MKWVSFLERLLENCKLVRNSTALLKLMEALMGFTSSGQWPGFPKSPCSATRQERQSMNPICPFQFRICYDSMRSVCSFAFFFFLCNPFKPNTSLFPCGSDSAVSVGTANISPKAAACLLQRHTSAQGPFPLQDINVLATVSSWQGACLRCRSHQARLSKPCWKVPCSVAVLSYTLQGVTLERRLLGHTHLPAALFSARKTQFNCSFRKFDLEVINTHQIYTFTVSVLNSCFTLLSVLQKLQHSTRKLQRIRATNPFTAPGYTFLVKWSLTVTFPLPSLSAFDQSNISSNIPGKRCSLSPYSVPSVVGAESYQRWTTAFCFVLTSAVTQQEQERTLQPWDSIILWWLTVRSHTPCWKDIFKANPNCKPRSEACSQIFVYTHVCKY